MFGRLNSEYCAANVPVSIYCIGYCERPRDVSRKNMRHSMFTM